MTVSELRDALGKYRGDMKVAYGSMDEYFPLESQHVATMELVFSGPGILTTPGPKQHGEEWVVI